MKQRLSRLSWPLLALVVTVALALARTVRTPRFYFTDDTERGSFGQWWQLGEHLLQGRIPLLDPSAWQAGNYLAEGQWGLLNPVVWVIALATRGSEDPVLLVTVVKVVFLGVMAVGAYLLARSFGAHRPWAALAGVLLPQVGFTVYMDAASWSNGLFNTALLPWVWWGLRRAVEGRRSPVPYLIASYVLITFGYVFGVMVLVVILVESLVRHAVRRDGRRVVRTLLASVWGGALTILVYLPGILTAGVSERGAAPFDNYRFLNADLTDLAAAASPTVTATIRAWDGDVTLAPLVYIAWALPLLPLFLPLRRSTVRRVLPLLVVGGIALFAVLAPSHMGAIRWPLRFIPDLSLALIVLFAVAASQAYPRRITPRGAWWSAGAITLAAAVSWTDAPTAWQSIGAAAALQLVALVALLWIARRPWATARVGRAPWSTTRATALAVAGAVLVTTVATAAQVLTLPRSPLPDGDAPDVATMRSVLPEAEAGGDAVAVGNTGAYDDEPASWHERLRENLWYLSDTNVINLYTVLPYTAFIDDLCADESEHLRTCVDEAGLGALWSVDPDTGMRVSDLMSVSTVVAMKRTFPEAPDVPEGWTLAAEGDYTWVVRRDEPLPEAGGVVWEGDGTQVSEVTRDGASATFTVDAVGDDARVALSRLDYPGYSVDGGAQLADPIRGWLLTVDVSDVAPGETVTVRFAPPATPLLVASAALAALAGAAWLVVWGRQRRRVRR
ncbi:YfhO family protein [Microbacterium marinilacus]|uniref:YfhO family protein n=1 Tax=Microbacterium marinilacus TaxID=415209 RepID=UPI001C8D8E0D|nr:YfhO family protein [Microbacterium marinilacus]MBY0687192.1 YfhO family protein [Microbacterium marinilacus]